MQQRLFVRSNLPSKRKAAIVENQMPPEAPYGAQFRGLDQINHYDEMDPLVYSEYDMTQKVRLPHIGGG